MRSRKSFIRPTAFRDAKLVIIACEGETEVVYFEALRDYITLRNVSIHVLPKKKRDSNPQAVFDQLDEFARSLDLEAQDELWIVIDRDKWTEQMLAQVAQYCVQKENMRLAVSNPCFELWLLLHFEDIENLTESEVKQLKENKRNSKRGDTWLVKRVRRNMKSFSKKKFKTEILMDKISKANERAKKLDKNPQKRWPEEVGTHVYKIIENIKILRTSSLDFPLK